MAVAAPRLRDPRRGRTRLALALPQDAVLEIERLPRCRWIVGDPVGDDVVIGLVRRRNLHELDASGPPFALGLDPPGRAQLVARFEILVACDVAVTLHDAEAEWIGGREGGDEQPLGVHAWTPDPFTGSG